MQFIFKKYHRFGFHTKTGRLFRFQTGLILNRAPEDCYWSLKKNSIHSFAIREQYILPVADKVCLL